MVTGSLAVPFSPTLKIEPETTQSDSPTGVAAELALPHNPLPTELDSSQLKNASITLPEGMTLNPSAATGLKACTLAQIGIGTRNLVTCPIESRLGTVSLNVPDLPENAEGPHLPWRHRTDYGRVEPRTA